MSLCYQIFENKKRKINEDIEFLKKATYPKKGSH